MAPKSDHNNTHLAVLDGHVYLAPHQVSAIDWASRRVTRDEINSSRRFFPFSVPPFPFFKSTLPKPRDGRHPSGLSQETQAVFARVDR
jgi:hypothetical protein